MTDSVGGWSMTVRPAHARGRKGTFRVTLLNQTLTPAAVSVVARDVEDALDIQVEPEGPVIVPSGCESLVTIRVAPRARRRRTRERPYPLELQGIQLGRETEADPALLRQARFTYAPRRAPRWLPRWSRRVLVPAIVAALALSLLAFAGARALNTAETNATATPTSAPLAPGAAGAGQGPLIQSFVALPSQPGRPGGPFVLSWTTSNTTQVTLNGQAVAASGSREVPAPARLTVYTLRVRDRAGHVEQRPVYVVPNIIPAPVATPPALPRTASATPPPLPALGPAASPAVPSPATPMAPGSVVIVNPMAVSFSTSTTITGAITQTVHLANLGPGSITVTSIVVHGAAAASFRTSDTCRGRTIASAGGCSIAVTLAPGSSGHRDATLIIADTGARRPHRVPLHAGS